MVALVVGIATELLYANCRCGIKNSSLNLSLKYIFDTSTHLNIKSFSHKSFVIVSGGLNVIYYG